MKKTTGLHIDMISTALQARRGVAHFEVRRGSARIDGAPAPGSEGLSPRAEIPGSFWPAENAQSMTPISVQFRKVLRAHIVGLGGS